MNTLPKAAEHTQSERDVPPRVDFIHKLSGNFSKSFDSFSLGQQLLLLTHNPLLITELFTGGDTDVEVGSCGISAAGAH